MVHCLSYYCCIIIPLIPVGYGFKEYAFILLMYLGVSQGQFDVFQAQLGSPDHFNWVWLASLGKVLFSCAVRGIRHARMMVQKLFKTVFVLCLLIGHWPKQITWSSPQLRNRKPYHLTPAWENTTKLHRKKYGYLMLLMEGSGEL